MLARFVISSKEWWRAVPDIDLHLVSPSSPKPYEIVSIWQISCEKDDWFCLVSYVSILVHHAMTAWDLETGVLASDVRP
jgi:hypothetical protein